MKLLDKIKRNNVVTVNIKKAILIIVLGILIHCIIFVSGGTKTAWAPLNIIPIILASYYWQVKGGVVVASLLGVYTASIPLSVADALEQDASNWIIRMLIYILLAYIAGYFVQQDIELNKKIREKDLRNSLNGLYNINKLLPELQEKINNLESSYLIVLKIKNLEGIGKYVNSSVIREINNLFIKNIKESFEAITIYSINDDEYSFILKQYDKYEIKQKLNQIIKDKCIMMKIEDYIFRLQIKGSIIHFGSEKIDAIDLINKARVALDQGAILESGIYFYNAEIEYNERLQYEIAGSMVSAIKNNEFYLVYQPIINIQENRIDGAEVLLRWDRGVRKPIAPNIFIDVAEKIGLITEISKWVIEKNIIQRNKWSSKGIEINTSINLTAQEITDDSFCEWLRNLIETHHIDRTKIGIEITERVFSTDEKMLKDVLLDIKRKGYYILIDDFGTGYNSLMTIGNIPSDIIKIDKYFIDHIDEIGMKKIVKHTIEGCHEMGKKVVAEGVETKKQVEILEEMGCDKLQGYYFSKPLLPEDFEQFYMNFNLQ